MTEIDVTQLWSLITIVKQGNEAKYKISRVCCHLCVQATTPREMGLCSSAL